MTYTVFSGTLNPTQSILNYGVQFSEDLWLADVIGVCWSQIVRVSVRRMRAICCTLLSPELASDCRCLVSCMTSLAGLDTGSFVSCRRVVYAKTVGCHSVAVCLARRLNRSGRSRCVDAESSWSVQRLCHFTDSLSATSSVQFRCAENVSSY